MRFGIIRERKIPPDRRAVLSPWACTKLLDKYTDARIIVEPSPIRAFADKEYRDIGIEVASKMNECDVLLGVKEVPIDYLIPNKKYFFFSHTIKKQPYNQQLLRTVLERNIKLYDHEVITAPNGRRLVAFGRYAGIVGAYNGIRAYGLKSDLFTLPKAEHLQDQQALIAELRKIKLPNIKILVTGKGRVGGGVREMLDVMDIRKVVVGDYLKKSYDQAVYCRIDVSEYNRRKDGARGSKSDFLAHPHEYRSNFLRFSKVTDLYMAGHFYGDDGSPSLYTREDTEHPDFKIRVVADISCDIDGPIASTIRASTIKDPIYGYDPRTGSETDFKNPNAIAVMAVDNLPCELPRDASAGFGESFLKKVIPAFFNGDRDGILERARMTRNGKLTPRYAYLQDYSTIHPLSL